MEVLARAAAGGDGAGEQPLSAVRPTLPSGAGTLERLSGGQIPGNPEGALETGAWASPYAGGYTT